MSRRRSPLELSVGRRFTGVHLPRPPSASPVKAIPLRVGLDHPLARPRSPMSVIRVKGGPLVARQGLVSQLRDGATHRPLEPGQPIRGGAGQFQPPLILPPQPALAPPAKCSRLNGSRHETQAIITITTGNGCALLTTLPHQMPTSRTAEAISMR